MAGMESTANTRSVVPIAIITIIIGVTIRRPASRVVSFPSP